MLAKGTLNSAQPLVEPSTFSVNGCSLNFIEAIRLLEKFVEAALCPDCDQKAVQPDKGSSGLFVSPRYGVTE